MPSRRIALLKQKVLPLATSVEHVQPFLDNSDQSEAKENSVESQASLAYVEWKKALQKEGTSAG